MCITSVMSNQVHPQQPEAGPVIHQVRNVSLTRLVQGEPVVIEFLEGDRGWSSGICGCFHDVPNCEYYTS